MLKVTEKNIKEHKSREIIINTEICRLKYVEEDPTDNFLESYALMSSKPD